MRFKVTIQGAPAPRNFCEWHSVIWMNSGVIETASGICVLSWRRREYACELSRRRQDGVWNMCAITKLSRVCMWAITTSSRQRLEYVCYDDAVESMQVSHHDAVATNMWAIWKALGAYSQTWQLMQRGFKYRCVASRRLSIQIVFRMLEWSWIPPSQGRHRKEIVGMRESLGSEGI